ncbi:MAG: TIGR02206 family membrane protein [Clostridia bacterium]|nr:TIGR02206 family membrane protein [Clostridia bacterium]MDD4387126.1 TIGR02206 family membrane protein [Clostridia bacterium]
MKDFFTDVGGTPFILFGPLHMFISIVTIIIAILIFIYRDKLKTFKFKENIRYILAAVLFTNMSVFYASLILLKEYDWRVDLPLHFCFITGYLFMYILITGNKKLYSVIYFFTFVGPIPAMIWPDLAFNYDRIIFWQFVISHHFMLLSSLYVLTVLEYKICKKDIVKAYMIGNVIVVIMAIFNNLFKTNYIMMGELPAQIYKIYPFAKYMPPIFWLELVALCAIAIAYVPAYLINKSGNIEEKVNEILLDDNDLKYIR